MLFVLYSNNKDTFRRSMFFVAVSFSPSTDSFGRKKDTQGSFDFFAFSAKNENCALRTTQILGSRPRRILCVSSCPNVSRRGYDGNGNLESCGSWFWVILCQWLKTIQKQVSKRKTSLSKPGTSMGVEVWG